VWEEWVIQHPPCSAAESGGRAMSRKSRKAQWRRKWKCRLAHRAVSPADIRSDLKDLVAYTYATALDGSPTIREWLRVAWVWLVCPMQIKGEQNRRAMQLLYQGVGFVTRGGVVALLKPFGLLLLIVVLAWFGFSSIANLLTKFVH
jgi:hypothetical protein